ncbi:eukaryotic translation initiation factor 2A-like [Dysidea avara]|uniref:eukaryotic translation initiation factor 2A-like n=1 Tax=Dysidea avara TaxID=196820 RepID=UPI003322C8D7
MAECSITEEALQLAVRGSQGIYVVTGDGKKKEVISTSSNCRVFEFSSNGSLLAWCDGTSVIAMDCATNEKLFELALPRTRCLRFSPKGSHLVTWEPYIVTKDIPAGQSNFHIWDIHGQLVTEYIQKKQEDWCPQWSEDECLCCRNITNEVHCFDNGIPGKVVSQKLQVAGLAKYSLSPGLKPYKIVAYIPGSKGAPSFVRMYTYPNLSAVVASRSFYKADTVNFAWNRKGTAVLVVTATDVDKSGASYYGEQGLYYLSAKGVGNIIPLKKKGPIYGVEWSPNSEEFCVCYGFMPANVTLFNQSCEKVYDFGSGHRNTVCFNIHGSILTLAGFGNLRGNMEFWNKKELKNFSNFQASDSTSYEWAQDGVHFVTATTAPRLREGNGFKIWHVTQGIIYTCDISRPHELWEVKWRPPKSPFPEVDLSKLASPSISKTPLKDKPAAYVPPALRGKPQSSKPKLHEFEPPESLSKGDSTSESLSKSAQKNKRKKEARLKATQEPSQPSERQDVLATVAYITKPSATTTSSSKTTENEKTLKSLRKKLHQIEQLKEKQLKGEKLEANQIEKIKAEDSIIEAIQSLEMGST